MLDTLIDMSSPDELLSVAPRDRDALRLMSGGVLPTPLPSSA
jgi:hypothetical protein